MAALRDDPAVIVPMGVSGCGKSTIGAKLACRLGWEFKEGDDFHSAANVAKMRAGIPLDDADRLPWLAAIAAWIDACIARGLRAVVPCSALKRSYRTFLRDACPGLVFVYLRVPESELRRRVAQRHHRYMPASLLNSQLEALEEPAPREPRVLIIDATGAVEAAVGDILARLGLPGGRPGNDDQA